MAALLSELITLVVLIIDFHSTVDSYTLQLYPFGTEAGDKSLPVEDDNTSQRISTPEFPFFGKYFTALYVNENGLISFGTQIRSPEASPTGFPLSDKLYVAAPYWADVFTKRGGNVWYRVTSENVTIARVTKDIRRAFPRYRGFVATWAAIATWNDVTFYGASGIYLQKRNTFQVLIASNGHMSFVGYLYDKLSWTTGTLDGGNQSGLGGRPAKVGFSYGNSYYQPAVSGTDDILALASTTNCGRAGVWFFRIDEVETIDDNICESEESVSVYPGGEALPTGSSILVTGLCYRPESDLLCDFGEAGTVKGQKFNDTNAVCSAPFTASRKEVEVYFYPSDVNKLKFAKVINLEPIKFYHASVQLIEYPTAWISGSRVHITWNPNELADQPITVDIINIVYHLATIQVDSNITVVSEQGNTGKAEFDLPELDNSSKDPMQPKQLQIIRVQSLVRDGYKYVSKHWIWSDLFLLTSELLAHKSCLHWVEVQSEDVQFHNKAYKSLYLCPKTQRQLLADEGRFTACNLYYNHTTHSCYLTRTQSDENLEQECCYDNEGELTRGPPCTVTNLTKFRQTAASSFSMFRENVVPYLECCVFSENCFKYRDLGMPVNDPRYIPPSIGASFGDPHILTLDGVEYTFNGYGEYTVLNANNSEFLLQGRMQPLNGGQGMKSPAAGFTAFAIRQRGGSTIQVHQDISRSIVLFINGVQRVIDFDHELQTTGVYIRNSSRGDYLRIVLAFNCGITVYVENAAVLQMAVTVPVEFKEKTKGLLGYWNDNTDEEYVLPNGEFLSTDSTMSQVHHYFGQRWTTTAIESLFTYGPNELHADHFNSSYVPMFMEAYDPILAKMDSGVRKRALRACEHSFQCIFDIAVTGREDIGEDTNDFQKWLLKMKRNLHDEGCNAVLTLQSGSVQTHIEDGVITHHFKCNQDYVMVGKDRISCRGGVWDGSKPRCYKEASIMCKSLDISIPNGTFEGQGNTFGDRYTFKCDLPFSLIGNNEIICGKDGLWIGQIPVCQRKQPRKAPSRQTTVIPVVIIGVVVSIIAILIIVLTIWLVRKHRRKLPGTETAGDQQGEAV